LGFEISGAANAITLAPGELLKYMIKPTGLVLTDSQMSGILKAETTNDNDTGQFFAQVHNTSRVQQEFGYPRIEFPNTWENTEFDVSWLSRIAGTNYAVFNKDVTATYSYPHNIDPNEVEISGSVSSTEKTISYRVSFSGLKNEDSSDYGISPDLPYAFKVEYKNHTTNSPTDLPASGFESGWTFYPAGSAASGIAFDLPFYDLRDDAENIPATYTFFLNYKSAGYTGIKSTTLKIDLDHGKLKGNYFSDLKAEAISQPKDEDLHKVTTINIPADIIARQRLVIGIEDIKSIEKVFTKNGVYVSNSYNLDFSIYTFSLKVNEFIPDYPGINKLDTVKYYVSFNNGEWQRMSPMEREIEKENENIIPKLFVFDMVNNIEEASLVKYLNETGAINNFRIKIVIDVSSVTNATFVPPEIRNYKCMIFDKEHFISFEA